MSNDDFVVVIAQSGAAYAYDEGYRNIIKLGESYDESLETICTYGLKPYHAKSK